MLRIILAILSVGIFMPLSIHATELAPYKVSDIKVKQSPNDDRDYQVITLSNALQILLISDPDLENSAVSISVPVGSMHNPDSQLGLAHYLEHMLFLGSERYPTINEYSKFMSQNGGYTNAYTSQQSTVYGFEVNDKAFEEALDRLGDVMRAPLLDEKYAEKERHTVNAEHKTYFDNDMRKLYALQRYTLNPDHPMARFSTGDLSTLVDKENSQLQTELVDFFNQHYSANTMKVALTSPRSIEALSEVASTYLTQIPNRNTQQPTILEPLLTEKQLAIKVEMQPSADIKLLQVNFLVPSVKAEYMYQPGSYISRLLGSDHQGGLSDTLIKAGLVDSVMAGFHANHSDFYSSFSLQFKLTSQGLDSQDQIMSTLFAYIELIKKQGINAGQYAEQKKSLETRFKFLSKYSGFNYVMSLAANMQQYPIKDILYFPYRLDAFNGKFITQLISYLTPDNSRLFLLSPDAKGDTDIPYYAGQYALEKIPMSLKDKWLNDATNIEMVLPSNNIWQPDDLSIVAVQYPGNATPLVQQKGHSVWFAQSAEIVEPKASIKLQLNNNIADQNAENRVSMSLLLALLRKQFSELNFSTQEAGLGFSVSQSNGLLISTSGYSDKQDKLLLTVLEHIKNATFSEQSLQFAKQDVQRQIRNKGKMKAMDLAFASFRQLLRQPAWEDKTLLDAIDKVSVKDIEQLKKALLTESTSRLLVLGNLSEAQVLTLDKQILRYISRNSDDFYHIQHLQANPKQAPLNYSRASEVQDDALAMIHLTNFKGEKALATAELLNKLLQPAFYDQIRTQEQLSYSPFSASFNVNKQVAFGLFTQSSAASNKTLYERFNVFLASFSPTLNAFTDAEFENIKSAHIANYLTKPTSLRNEFGYLSKQWLNIEEDINTKAAYIDVLKSIALVDVQRFYQDVLLSEKNKQLILIQVQGQKFIESPILTLPEQVEVKNIDKLAKLACLHQMCAD